jgi:hypothetical protein
VLSGIAASSRSLGGPEACGVPVLEPPPSSSAPPPSATASTATTATAAAIATAGHRHDRPRADSAAAAGAAAPFATVRSGTATELPSTAASAARPRSPAEGYRSSGRFAIARSSTGSNAPGTSAQAAVADGAGSLRCAYIFATLESRGNGTLPVSVS